jgi:hypothetical protein
MPPTEVGVAFGAGGVWFGLTDGLRYTPTVKAGRLEGGKVTKRAGL